MKPSQAIAHGMPETPRVDLGSRRLRLAEITPSGVWEPVAGRERAPTTSTVLPVRCPELPAEIAAALVETLARPLRPGETHRTGNDARERELYAVLATLTPVQCLELRRRLERDRDGDPLAVAFRRLVIERRGRVRAFLAHALRRAS